MNFTSERKVIIQGITESRASYYAARMKAYGTNIVAGISAGRGGQKINEIPIFDLVEEAVAQVGEVKTTLIFVDPYEVIDAAKEAIAAGIEQIIIISSGVPPLDMVRLLQKAQTTNTLILGPGSGGIIVPEKMWLGTLEPQFYTAGKVGLISCSTRLCYEVALELNKAGNGESIAVSIGNEKTIGSDFLQWLQILEQDKNTEAIVLIGLTHESPEDDVASYINSKIKKPVVAYIAGQQIPLELSYKNAAAIIANQLSYSVAANDTDNQKIAALQKAKVSIAKRPSQIPDLIKKALKNH